MASSDDKYLSLLVNPIRFSSSYRPKFGLGKAGIGLEEFSALYAADPFYSWIGLDSPLVYSAHKAAGGITSIYRRLGIGCERLFRTLIQDMLNLTEAQSNWEYRITVAGGQERVLKLDGRIDTENIADLQARERVNRWLQGFREKLDVKTEVKGSVFEVRQGYKSKDSKRQNADLANAASAYTQQYLPVLTVMSLQLDTDLRIRYEGAKWGVLAGVTDSDDPYYSTYAFCNQVLMYDLAAFFQRNSEQLRSEVTRVVNSLLEPT